MHSPGVTAVWDLNCDLGEGEPEEWTVGLLERVDSANVACGGHAGDERSMRFCLGAARDRGVRVGAHPGWGPAGGMGRAACAPPTTEELVALLDEQVGRLESLADGLGVRLWHVKLHGILYHQVDASPELARAYLQWVQRKDAGLVIYARAGGGVAAAATATDRGGGVEVWPEAFLDRGYRGDGTLVPRGEAGALLHRPEEVTARLAELRETGGWRAVDGAWIGLRPRTFCVHGDSPGAPAILEAVRKILPRRPSVGTAGERT